MSPPVDQCITDVGLNYKISHAGDFVWDRNGLTFFWKIIADQLVQPLAGRFDLAEADEGFSTLLYDLVVTQVKLNRSRFTFQIKSDVDRFGGRVDTQIGHGSVWL